FDGGNRMIRELNLSLYQCAADEREPLPDGWAPGNAAANLKLLGLRPCAITDGASNTVWVSEVPTSWQQAWFTGPVRDFLSFEGTRHGSCVPVLFADGSVRSLSTALSATVREALVTPDGGEVIDCSDF